MKKRYNVGMFILFVVIIGWALVQFLPLIWMLNTSLKTSQEIVQFPLKLAWLPTFKNYPIAWTGEKSNVVLRLYFSNSLIVVSATMIALTLIATLAAYALARYKFKGQRFFLMLLIGMVAVPMHSLIIPLYHLIKTMGLLNRYPGLILVYSTVGLPMSILILQSYFRGFPSELEDAARVDGCKELEVFWYIVAPISKGALSAVAIVNFIAFWNELFLGMVLLWGNNVKTLPVGLLGYRGLWGQTSWGPLFAGLSIATVPMIVFYLIFSKNIMRGMTLGSFR
ncbi:MAG: carbohydrate ABC transporter permease [Firmicutes bacterium]|nr:carbohydrate ABC transporter permease [Bacillota bacterium]